jgi:PPOX class probable F420-dependent enzyme
MAGRLSAGGIALKAPPDFEDLLRAPNTAVLGTVMGEGSLQGSPVWYWFDGASVHVSTVSARQKYRNQRRDPRLVLTVLDPARPLRYIEIRGTAELHDDPDGEMRDRIAVKHGFPDGTVFDAAGDERVTVTIAPTRIRTSSSREWSSW